MDLVVMDPVAMDPVTSEVIIANNNSLWYLDDIDYTDSWSETGFRKSLILKISIISDFIFIFLNGNKLYGTSSAQKGNDRWVNFVELYTYTMSEFTLNYSYYNSRLIW